MIDFNWVLPEGVPRGTIPHSTKVLLEIAVKEPRKSKRGSHPLLNRDDDGGEFLSTTLTIVAGVFVGQVIHHNFYTTPASRGYAASRAALCAIIESARGVTPGDASPQACQARTLIDWSDLNGMQFVGVVGEKKGRVHASRYLAKVVPCGEKDEQHTRQWGDTLLVTP